MFPICMLSFLEHICNSQGFHKINVRNWYAVSDEIHVRNHYVTVNRLKSCS